MRDFDTQQQSVSSKGSAVLEPNLSAQAVMGDAQQSDASALLTGKRSLLYLIPILLLMSWCYAPAVINAFHGDDFLHVQWLSRASHDTKLIWDNFVGPWMGAATVKFYRPLVSVTLFADYLLYNFNAAGFHVTNILYHMASAVCLFFIGQRIALLAGYQKETARTVGVFASVLWGIYPLNAEAVSWITGRVDATVTAFSMGSLLTYLQWRDNNKKLTLALSLTLFILALLCKEMAIILPPLFAFIDVLFSSGTSWKSRLRSLPFWGVLGGYFAVRQLTMGTMIGAYDDSLGLDLKHLWKRFRGGMPFFFVPFNMAVFPKGDVVIKCWTALLAFIGISGIVQIFATRMRAWRFYLFCAGWFALALIPVYKVFDVAQDLESSRYAYLATLPLCLLFAALAAPLWRNRAVSGLQCAVFAAFVGIAATTLHTHNMVWHNAGEIGNRIKQQMYALVKDMPANPNIVLIGAPDNDQGAYIMRNALPGMVTPPYFPQVVGSAINLDRFCPIWPFGVLKDQWAISENMVLARWDDKNKSLVKTPLVPSPTGQVTLPLQNIKVGGGTMQQNADGKTVTINAPQKYTILDMRDLHEKCGDFDFVEVTLSNCRDNLDQSTMVYVNDLHPNAWPTFSSTVRPTVIQDSPGKQRMIFSFRQRPEWAIGGTCTELVFGVPSAGYTIESIKGLSANQLIPQITLPPGSISTGFLALTKNADSEVKVKHPKGTGLILELSPRYGYFDKQYPAAPETKGTIKQYAVDAPIIANATQFKDGMYQARVWIADAAGKPQGLSSDHFMLIVP